MLFKPYLAEAIVQGKKTQTHRLLPTPIGSVLVLHSGHIIAVYRNRRRLWRVGNTYAIQPGRGKKAIGRFRLLAIRQEYLQTITEEDARAEGIDHANPIEAFVKLWNDINPKPSTRWQDNPQVLVLTFKLVAPQ